MSLSSKRGAARTVDDDELLRHICWDRTFYSPLIGLLCDRRHAENWARRRVRTGLSVECEVLEIDTRKLPARCTVYKASQLVKYFELEDEIPEAARASIANGYFIFLLGPPV